MKLVLRNLNSILPLRRSIQGGGWALLPAVLMAAAAALLTDAAPTRAADPLVLTPNCSPLSGTAPLVVSCTPSTTGGVPPIVQFEYFVVGGNPGSGIGPSFTATYTASGAMKVTAIDSNGTIVSETLDVTITVTPPPPLVLTPNCSPLTGTAPLVVSCTPSTTGGVPPIVQFEYFVVGGNPGSGTGPSFSATYTASGIMKVTAIDSNGTIVSEILTVTITVTPPPPLVLTPNCSPLTGTAPLVVSCTPSTTGGVPPIVQFEYFVVGGNPGSGTGPSFSATYTASGIMKVTAIDSNGTIVSEILNVTMAPPVLTANCSPLSGTAPVLVNCTAAATGGTAPVTISYAAATGSPTSGSGASFATTYLAAGTHTIVVTATDSLGRTDTETFNVTVLAAPITIDVWPGLNVNPFVCRSPFILPVALFSTAGFDATKLDVASLRLNGTVPALARTHAIDLNWDGRKDLLVYFDHKAVASAIGCPLANGTIVPVTITGKTVGGLSVTGSDKLRIVSVW
jgi:hypothetical protein